MSENNGLEVSCWTDMSPTTIFTERQHGVPSQLVACRGEGCTRGGGYGGWVGGGLYRGTTRHPPGPIFQSYLASGPYPGPNEGNSHAFHEVS